MKLVKILHCKFSNFISSEGLRTLVISQKMLEDEFFELWSRRYNEAKTDLNNREESMMNCVLELEQDMELLGVTGVEGILS